MRRTLMASLIAGAIAIIANEAALLSADLIHLQTAHGGLLKLLSQSIGITPPHGAGFKIGFHLFIGMVMALIYGFIVAPMWRGSAWRIGLMCAVLVWLANALIVLPLIGEGIAGSAHLGLAGLLWFAGAHTLFFVLLAVLYAGFRRRFAQPDR